MRWQLSFFGVATVVAGCGGGGNAASGDKAGSEQQYGLVTARAVGAIGQPVVMGNGKAVFTGISGAKFTKVAINLPPLESLEPDEALKQSAIALSYNNRPYIYDLATEELTAITPEQAYTNDPTPCIAPNGLRLVASMIAPGATLGLYTMNLDGTSKTVLAHSPGQFYVTPSFSPDGKTIVFRDSITGRLNTVPAGGGPLTPVTPEGTYAYYPAWTGDGQRIAFFYYDSEEETNKLALIDKDGTGMVDFTDTEDRGYISFFPGLNTFLHTNKEGANYIVERYLLGVSGYWYPILSTTREIAHASLAPTADRFVYQEIDPNPGIHVYHMPSGSDTVIAQGNYGVPTWGPYMQNRSLVGSQTPFGLEIGGFIFGQVGQRVTSFVGIDAVTRSTIKIEKQDGNPSGSVAVCVVTADSVKFLKYLNNLNGGTITVATGANPISGAVIAFDADKGRVATVAPFTGTVTTQSNGFNAKFLGVYDAKGKNLAPNGTRSLALDTSGRASF